MLDNVQKPQPNLRNFIGKILPHLAKDQVDTSNKLANFKPSGVIEFGGQTLEYSWQNSIPTDVQLTDEIRVTAGTFNLIANIERGSLEGIFVNRVDFKNAEMGLYAMLAEHSLSAWITKFVERAKENAEFSYQEDVGDILVSPYTFSVGVAGQSEKFYVKLHGTKELLSEMFKIDPIVRTDVPLRQLRLNAVMETSVITISQADLSGTSVGDVLSFESDQEFNEIFRLAIGGFNIGKIQIGNDGFILTDVRFDRKKSKPEGNSQMKSEQTDQAMGAFEVEVSVEVAQCAMTVSAVSALSPGAIIDFGSISPNHIKLRANGEIFAHAELIEIGDGIGLKITKVL